MSSCIKAKRKLPLLFRAWSTGAVILLGLALISGCSSLSDAGNADTSTSNEAADNGSTDSSSDVVDEAVAEEPGADTSEGDSGILSYSGSQDIETPDGYTFNIGWDWRLTDAISDVENSIPGETEVKVTSAGEATLENTTKGRTIDSGISSFLVRAYFDDSSAVCENTSSDDEVSGCWLTLGHTFYLDIDSSDGRFSLGDGEVQIADFSLEYLPGQGPERTFNQIEEASAEDYIVALQNPKYITVLVDGGILSKIEYETPETSDICMTLLGGAMERNMMISATPALTCDELDEIDDFE